MFPNTICLLENVSVERGSTFHRVWTECMQEDCHRHSVWNGRFVRHLAAVDSPPSAMFSLAAVWSVNMIAGSYCFPRYAAALAARAEQDAVRHGLLENAWDESGSHHHTSRSHFWLAVRLGRLLGLSDADIERIRPLPEALRYTDEHYQKCANGDFGFAFGMICLIEEFTTPEFTMIFKAFLHSCETGLKLKPDEFVLKGGAEYFTANIADDERHREEMPRLVATWLHANGTDLNDPKAVACGLESVRAGARHSADLRQEFFEGIVRFVGDGATFRDLIATD